jgi:hypothetical protein
MISRSPSRTREGASVLVVHVSHAVGGVLGQRLAGTATVVLTDVRAARRILRTFPPPDVVVLCPYLTEAERTALLADASKAGAPPSVIELTDEPGDRGFRIHRLTFATAASERRQLAAYGSVSQVLRALADTDSGEDLAADLQVRA